MATIDALYDSILIDIAGLSDAIAVQELRNACIDFFTDTRVWTKDLVIDSVGGQMAYTLTPDANTDVVEILEVRYTGVDDPLTPGGPALLDTLFDNWRTGATGTPSYYYSDVEMLTLNLVLPPGSSATGGINCKIAQCPQKDQNTIPDWTERKYVDVIGARMKARCPGAAGGRTASRSGGRPTIQWCCGSRARARSASARPAVASRIRIRRPLWTMPTARLCSAVPALGSSTWWWRSARRRRRPQPRQTPA